jgi:cytochrome P450
MLKLPTPNTVEGYYSLPPGENKPGLIRIIRAFLNPHGYVESMVNRYGAIYRDSFFGFPNIVFITDPQAIQQIFTADPNLFLCGEGNAILRPFIGDNSLVFLDGDRHQKRRKLLMPPFHGERMKTYGDIIRTVTLQVMDEQVRQRQFIARPPMQEISLEVILQAVFGLNRGDRCEQIRQGLVNYLDFFNSPLNSAMIFFPFLQKDLGAWSPWGKFQRFKQRIDFLLTEEIETRRKQPDKSSQDILTLLLTATDEEGKGLTTPELRDELFSLLIAGHESTSLSICWALYWIYLIPEVRRRLQEELATVDLSTADPMEVVRLPYLSAICSETLRIYPVAFTAFTRILQAPMDLGGYRLTAGTYLSIPIYNVHQRQDIYPNPKQFNPDRFLDRQYSPYEYIPFGGANRRCLGSAFALFEMKIVLATVVANYPLELNETKPLLPVRRGAIFAPAGGVRLKVRA